MKRQWQQHCVRKWYHCVGMRSKKRYFNYFTNRLDVALVNAWILHSVVVEKIMTLLSFRCYVTKSYLKLQSASDPKSAGRPKMSSNVMMATTLSPTGHVLERTEGGKQRKCAACKKKVSKQCRSVTLVCTWANAWHSPGVRKLFG